MKIIYKRKEKVFNYSIIFRVIRLATLFLMIGMSTLFANAKSVHPDIVHQEKQKTTLKDLFNAIEEQSNYVIFYEDNVVNLDKEISIEVKGKSIETILNECLESSNSYIISDRQIYITRANQTKEVIQNQQDERIITGRVTDKENDEPLIGATVWIKETTNGAITDSEGYFTLKVKGTAGILSFSYLGYTPTEIPIGNRNEFLIQLESDDEGLLGEVMVVAYGQQKRESIVGAISTISVDKLKGPTSKISNILAGQLAGILGMTRSGEPGSGSDFYIRGISTFGASSGPLVLIDGVERSLDLVDPEDIESFSILKDATATAVYGVRGANGVLLINTRKGVEGKPKITVRAEAGILGSTKLPKFVNSPQWAELYNEAYASAHNGQKFYTEADLEKYGNNSDPDLFPNVDWMKTLYKDWTSNQRVNVNITGGGSMVRYYVASSYYNEGSIYRENKKETGYDSSANFNKINFRANIDLNVTPTTVLNVNLANIYEKTKSAGSGSIWWAAAQASPHAFPAKYSDGTIAKPETSPNPYNELVYSGYADRWWNNAQTLVGLTQDLGDIITPGLKANIKFSFDALTHNSVTRGFTPMTKIATGRDEAGELIYKVTQQGNEHLGFDKGNSGDRVTYLEAQTSYERIFAATHRVGALFLYNQRERYNIAPGDPYSSLPYRSQGIAGRVTYGLMDKYFAEFNVGYNGSENFSPGKRFGVFPAGAIGWLVSEETFWGDMKNKVDILKLKASYGLVGNDQLGGGRRFIYEETISGGPGYTWNNFHHIFPGGAIQIGETANQNVGWEETAKTNIGIEFSLFRSLRIQADYFYEKTKGIFIRRASIPEFVGISTSPFVNIGKMKNQGIDASLEFDRQVGDFFVTSRANFTYAHNELLDQDQPSYTDKYRDRIGKRKDQIYGLVATGFFRDEDEIRKSPPQFGTLSPGDIKYKDINGDGVVNESDEVPIGYSNFPEIVYGFGATVSWKGIDLSAFFQGVGKVSIGVSQYHSYRPFSTGNMNSAAIAQDIYKHRWNADNMDGAKYPRVTFADVPNNNKFSTLWLHDGSFLRLKNVELGYTMPKRMLKNSFLGSVRFHVTGMNLLTFSKFKLWDPEIGGGIGVSYPPNRTISFGVNIKI